MRESLFGSSREGCGLCYWKQCSVLLYGTDEKIGAIHGLRPDKWVWCGSGDIVTVCQQWKTVKNHKCNVASQARTTQFVGVVLLSLKINPVCVE